MFIAILRLADIFTLRSERKPSAQERVPFRSSALNRAFTLSHTNHRGYTR